MHFKRFLFSLFLIAVSVEFFLKTENVFADPSISGDWIVSGTESYYNETIVLNGNLNVESSGTLTFRNVTLLMNCTYNGQYNITVKSSGKFYVLDGSVITSANPGKRIGFFDVQQGSTFRMNKGELHECGWSMLPKSIGMTIMSSDAVVENSLISHNWIGILVTDGVIVRNNTVTENDAQPESGIAVYGNSTIYNNYVSSNYGSGILISGHCTPTIHNNTVTGNWIGIYIETYSNPIIQGNTVIENGIQASGEGIFCQVYCNPIIQGNNITSNELGILFMDHSMGIIQNNIITSNRGNGIQCTDNSFPEVHWNDIYDNDGYGVENADSSVTVNATYNFWGNEPNPSTNVLFDPWLPESIFSAEITSPLSNELVISIVTVSTEIYARNGIHRVEFYIDDQLEHIDDAQPYEWSWNTTQYTETEHKVTLKAYDIFGLKVSKSIVVFVDNSPPTVFFEEPEPENNYSGTINVSVNAVDNQELHKVYVCFDNSTWLVMSYDLSDLLWKYDLDTTTLFDGEHTLTALALDKVGNPASTSTILFTDNKPPKLSIQSPQSGTTVALTLIVAVQASDVSGISKIEYYLQGTLVHMITDTPYQWSWDTTQYPNGEYIITVKAYDTAGKMETSETTVTVENVERPWWQTPSWIIVEVLIALGGLLVGVISLLRRGRGRVEDS